MKGEFIRYKNYYLKLSISELKKYQYRFSFISPGTLKYRLDGGSWVSVSGIPLYLYHQYNNPAVPIYLFQPTSINISSNTTIELYGQFADFKDGNDPIPVDSDVYRYFQSSAISEPIEMELYKLKCEPHLVTKSVGTDILLVGNVYGALREEIDLTSPFVTFEYDSVPDFNYIYIPSLSRYYFVNNITSIRTHVYRLDLHVDVLKTYDTDIRKQKAFISRNKNASKTIVDNRYPLSYKKQIVSGKTTPYDTPSGTTAVNVTFDFSSFTYNWVVDAMSKIDSVTYVQLQPSSRMSLYPKIASLKSTHNLLYALESGAMASFIDGIFKDSSLASYVNSFVLYPFDVTTITTYLGTSGLTINDKELDYSDNTFKAPSSVISPVAFRKLLCSTLGYIVVADFTMTPHFIGVEDFLNYEPFSKYEFYIPFIGWVELKSLDILNKRIIIYYGVDISSGFGTCYVKEYSTQKTLFSAPCQIGIKLPINTSNAEELTRQKQNNNLNLMLGLISSGVSVGIGATSGNPVAMVGGVLSGGKAIASFVNAQNLLIERAQTSFISTDTIAYDDIGSVKYRIYRPIVETFDSGVYGDIQGFPLNSYDDLSGFTGYTEIPEMHYVPDTQLYITKSEIDEIISLAKDGIIL